jgi:hypothetical protein
MVPSAEKFKQILREILRSVPDDESAKRYETSLPDGTKRMLTERQVVFSCVISAAESVERMEATVATLERWAQETVAPTLAALAKAVQLPSGAAAAAAPEADDTEDLPRTQATVVQSGPAAPPPQAASVSRATTPVAPANGQTVTTSAPAPIAPRA